MPGVSGRVTAILCCVDIRYSHPTLEGLRLNQQGSNDLTHLYDPNAQFDSKAVLFKEIYDGLMSTYSYRLTG